MANGEIVHKNIVPPYEISSLKMERTKIWKAQEDVKLPNNFSLTNNPDEVIMTIKRVASFFQQDRDLTLRVSCKDVTDMDLSALIVLDVIIVKGMNYIRRKGFSCTVGGDMPSNQEIFRLFTYSGLPKHLQAIIPSTNKAVETLDPFAAKDDTNLETHRIIEYYDKCLNHNGFKLNNKGKAYLSSLINEIVDNARIHSGLKKRFYCGGFYDHEARRGQLAIISFGNSMYESLNGESTNLIIKEQIKKHVHQQKQFFSFNYNEEMSWTVFALQYKISRLNNSASPDRGTGTIKFIEAFSKIGRASNHDDPKMCLVSGNTHILFDGTYNLKDETVNGQKVKVIAFNKENSLKKKPDQNYVKKMAEKFPGVVINVEFYMDASHLDKFKAKG